MKRHFLAGLMVLAVSLCGAGAMSDTPVTQESADAHLAAADWQSAAEAYLILLSSDSTDAANWFSYGTALHNLERYEEACEAYEKAIEYGFQPAARARYHLARALMSRGQESAALDELEVIAEIGGPTAVILKNTAEFAGLADNPRFLAVLAALTPCTDPEYRHFDFWLGEWDVRAAGASGVTASSRISSRQDGCVVLEEYENVQGFSGMSINFYDSVRKIWHQTWMGNGGGAVYLEGGLNEDGAMVLTDEGLDIAKVSGTINRVTWSQGDDGSVRQFWEVSSDQAKTWSVAFDGRYTKKKE